MSKKSKMYQLKLADAIKKYVCTIEGSLTPAPDLRKSKADNIPIGRIMKAGW